MVKAHCQLEILGGYSTINKGIFLSSLLVILQLADLMRMQTELSRKHQVEEDLSRELDDCHMLLQSKEADCTRLAKNLGASQVREAEQEAKWMYELQKVRQNLEFKIIRQQQEVRGIKSFNNLCLS